MHTSDFPTIYNELEAMDVVFRINPIANKKFPYTAFERNLDPDFGAVWDRLYKKEISEMDAIQEFKKLMESYYGIEYPLN